jgi:hypothetical protein
MPRTAAVLPEGVRISDLMTIGVLASKIPLDEVQRVLSESGKESKRIRQLPAHVMVYYVVALALYMNVSYEEVLRCLVEGLEWLGEPASRVRNTGRSAISQARARLGAEPLEALFRSLARPLGEAESQGVWYRQWRVVAIDGTTFDVGDTPANESAFGRPGASRGQSAFPQVRCVGLVECGTHAIFDLAAGPYATSEVGLAKHLIGSLKPEMLCLADRNYFSYERWNEAAATGAQLLWRVKSNLILPCEKRLEDGSYLSSLYPSAKDRRHGRSRIQVRVIEYRLDGVDDPEPLYRLVTTILDPTLAPALDLAALYHQRWEIENAFDEVKVHLRGRGVVLRSKTPDLVLQELYGLFLAHFAVRALMCEAAIRTSLDTDSLSFVHAVRVVRRKISKGAIPPSGENDPRGPR